MEGTGPLRIQGLEDRRCTVDWGGLRRLPEEEQMLLSHGE